MHSRLLQIGAVLLLVLFIAAGAHLLLPHEHDGGHHGQPCALCVLFFSFAIVAAGAFFIIDLPRRRVVVVRLDVRPSFVVALPTASRAPPSF